MFCAGEGNQRKACNMGLILDTDLIIFMSGALMFVGCRCVCPFQWETHSYGSSASILYILPCKFLQWYWHIIFHFWCSKEWRSSCVTVAFKFNHNVLRKHWRLLRRFNDHFRVCVYIYALYQLFCCIFPVDNFYRGIFLYNSSACVIELTF